LKEKENEIKIDFKYLTDYHNSVVGAFEEIVHKIEQNFGLELDDDDDWLFINKRKEDVEERVRNLINNDQIRAN